VPLIADFCPIISLYSEYVLEEPLPGTPPKEKEFPENSLLSGKD